MNRMSLKHLLFIKMIYSILNHYLGEFITFFIYLDYYYYKNFKQYIINLLY